MLAEFQTEIAVAVLSGVTLEVIEQDIIERAPLDEEQRSALWLYAEAVKHRPSRLIAVDGDFARADRSPGARRASSGARDASTRHTH